MVQETHIFRCQPSHSLRKNVRRNDTRTNRKYAYRVICRQSCVNHSRLLLLKLIHLGQQKQQDLAKVAHLNNAAFDTIFYNELDGLDRGDTDPGDVYDPLPGTRQPGSTSCPLDRHAKLRSDWALHLLPSSWPKTLEHQHCSLQNSYCVNIVINQQEIWWTYWNVE